MIIGLISDSHDNLPKIKKAIQLFRKKYVKLILHMGDIVAPFSILPFVKCGIEFRGVFGNNDGEKAGLIKASGGKISEGPLVIEKFGKTMAVAHELEKIDLNKKYDCIFYGHTHKPETKLENNTLYVNPGECGGWLYGKSTVAIVDLVAFNAKRFHL